MNDPSDIYRKHIAAVMEELTYWAKLKRDSEQQIGKLRALVIANANMLPDDEERRAFISHANELVSLGFTDSIRELFRKVFPRGLTPTGVRDGLVVEGWDLSTQVNPMASIHSVIRRLVAAGEIEPNETENGSYRCRFGEVQLPPVSRKK